MRLPGNCTGTLRNAELQICYYPSPGRVYAGTCESGHSHRPDIAFAVTKLAQFAARPSEEHFNKALYICRYLRGTSKYCLTYNGTSGEGLLACTDSDWASDPQQRRSQTGYFLKLAGGAI